MSKTKLAMLLIASLSMAQSAFANLSISPLKYEFSVNPWETKLEIISITNNDPNPVTLYTSKEDFTAWDETWTPKFIKPKDKTTDEYSLSNWISLDTENVTLAKWETREVKFTEPGWHYWAVFFSPWAPSKAQVAVVQRLWVLVLVNVAWELKIDWKLSGFETWVKDKSGFKAKNIFTDFPIAFETKFLNDWNVHIKPSWKITLTDESWNELKNVWKETIINDKWAFIWEKLVDYIPVNDVQWNVLPKSNRKFESLLQWFWYQELKEDGTKIVKFKDISDYYKDKKAESKQYVNFWETIRTRKTDKKITAKLEISYEWKDKVKKNFSDSKIITVSFEETYVGTSLLAISIVVILILGTFYYIRIYRPKAKEKLKKELMEEIKKRW